MDAGGRAPQLTEAEALLCRMRDMIDGMALGTEPFVENIFGWCRERFSEGRKSGARKLRGIATPLRTMRDLRKRAIRRPDVTPWGGR